VRRDPITFVAVLPSTQSAIRVHGDCGMRITLDIDDMHVQEALKLWRWRHEVLRVTVEVERR